MGTYPHSLNSLEPHVNPFIGAMTKFFEIRKQFLPIVIDATIFPDKPRRVMSSPVRPFARSPK